jgi:hypothetical protein
MGRVTLALAVGLVHLALLPAEGRGQPLPPWEATGLGDEVRELFTPSSGAFFARTADSLLRSDDGGTTWAPVALPPAPARRGARWAAVDPTNHMVLYAEGPDGLYQTRDDAASWALILPAPAAPATVEAIAVSPADPNVLYVYFLGGNTLYFFRSADGGMAWQRAEQAPGGGPCTSSVAFLQADPTDPARVYRAAGCYAGRNFGDALWQSTDQGATWAQTFRIQGTIPVRLAGGQGRSPERYYLAAQGAVPMAASHSVRSNDNGRSWQQLRTYESTTQGGTSLRGLAYDPQTPDRVWVGVGGISRGVQGSADGGTTWTELELGERSVNALALGIDARYLFAATDQGVWRLPLEP